MASLSFSMHDQSPDQCRRPITQHAIQRLRAPGRGIPHRSMLDEVHTLTVLIFMKTTSREHPQTGHIILFSMLTATFYP